MLSLYISSFCSRYFAAFQTEKGFSDNVSFKGDFPKLRKISSACFYSQSTNVIKWAGYNTEPSQTKKMNVFEKHIVTQLVTST